MTLSLEWFHNTYQTLNGTNNIWVAYSGGIDSRVLLELCAQYVKTFPNYTLQAIHVNHGLHKDADAWAAHCIQTCKNLEIPLYVAPIKLDLTTKASLEAVAREARHIVWQAFLPTNGTLLLAHHEQDQAETILYRLFRGAGIAGLSGMAEYCEFGKGVLLRPLLKVAKAEIELFAQTNKLTWIVDDSNDDRKFDRNFIRHAIIPELRKRWPKVINNITRSGELCAEVAPIIALEAQALLLELSGTVKDTLAINKLLSLDPIKCFAVLRAWLVQYNYQMPSRSQLYKIRNEVMLARIDACPILNFSQYIIRRYRDDLYLLPANENIKFVIPAAAGIQQDINTNIEVVISAAAGIHHDINLADGHKLRIKTTIGSGFVLPDTAKAITICLGSKGKKAKKIFQQHSIPPWQRHKYPLVFLDNLLIAIVGLWIKDGFAVVPGKFGIDIMLV